MEGVFGFLAYGAAAIACLLAVGWVAQRGAAERADKTASIVALGFTALWCAASAAIGMDRPLVLFAEIARNLAWIFVLLRLFANDGRDESLRIIRPVVAALCFVEFLRFFVVFVGTGGVLDAQGAQVAFTTASLLAVLVAVGVLVLLHNLYAGASGGARKVLGWCAGALALFWGFELNFHTVAYLTGSTSAELGALRGLVAFAFACGMAVGFTRAAPDLALRPSRAVTFQLLSLGLIGGYLVAMILLSGWVAQVSGDLARVTQVAFLLAAAGFAMLWLPSKRSRGWLRVMVLKHLFKHRYDYRNEWIRFTHTIGHATSDGQGLQTRAIRSLADITDSPSGLLFIPDEDSRLALAARWQWAGSDDEAPAIPKDFTRILAAKELIVDLDEARRGISHHGEVDFLPAWLLDNPRAWAVVPLMLETRLVGVIVLGRPSLARRLDWEDFDLLSIAGRQVASYLAEQAGQEALEEASRFDEFNRRMAFVMHDIKNLSSQMSLLVANAEKHADNPEFRKDMLVTLRNSTEKLNALLARLGRYRKGQGDAGAALELVDLATMARDLRGRFDKGGSVIVGDNGPCRVRADREALEQALVHIVQNALDASPGDKPVRIETRNDGLRGEFAVIDSGQGMSPAFIRNELFKPFVSTKEGGFGIGANEARTMIRAMGGRLEVDSREGFGSRFTVSLPLGEAQHLFARRTPQDIPQEDAVA